MNEILHYVAVTRPLRPLTAPLPISDRHVAPVPNRALPQRYAQADIFVGQVRPTLAALPAPAGFELAFVARSAQPQRYAKSDFVNQVRPTLAALAGAASFELSNRAVLAQPFEYARSDYAAPPKLNLPTISPFTIGWLMAGVQSTVDLVYAQSSWVLADKLQSTPLATFLDVAIGAQVRQPEYAITSLAIPEKAIASPATPTIAQWLTTDGDSALKLVFTPSALVAPDSMQAGVAIPTLAAWLATNGQAAIEPVFAGSTWVAPDAMQSTSVSPLLVWLTTDGKICTKPTFAPSASVGPVLSLAAQAVAATLPAWLTTDGKGAVELIFNAASTTAPDKPLSVVVSVLGRIDSAPVRQGGTPPVPGHNKPFAAPVAPVVSVQIPIGTSFVPNLPPMAMVLEYGQANNNAPDKSTGLPLAPATLAQWLTTDGVRAVEYVFASSSWSAADKLVAGAPVPPTIAQWLSTDGRQAVKFVFALGGVTAPEKSLPSLVLPLFGWRGEDAYAPKFDFYMMGDTLTGPATTASAQQAYASANTASTALHTQFSAASITLSAPVFPIVAVAATFLPGWLSTDSRVAVALPHTQPSAFTAPEKFNLIAAVQTFLPGWLTTDGALAVLLRYIKGDVAAPDKFGQATPVTLPSWFATDGKMAVLLKYLQGDTYSAPDKANLVAAAVTFLPGWLSTLGNTAVTLRYAPSDFVNQVRATLGTLATLLSGIADPGVNAQPQKFATGGTIAPEKSIPTPPTVTGWTATPGLPAVLLRYAKAETFVAQVAPTLETLPVLLAGIADPGIQKLVLRYWQPDPWISELMDLPFTGGNPVGLLAGKTIPLIGILTGKIVQAIGITSGKILNVVGITSGKVIS